MNKIIGCKFIALSLSLSLSSTRTCLFISVIWYDLLNQLMPHLTHYTPEAPNLYLTKVLALDERQSNLAGRKKIPMNQFIRISIAQKLEFD